MISFFRIISVLGVAIGALGLIKKYDNYKEKQALNNGETDVILPNTADIFGNPIITDTYGNIKPTRFNLGDTFKAKISNNLIDIMVKCDSKNQNYGLYTSPTGDLSNNGFSNYLGLYIDKNWTTKGTVYGDNGESTGTQVYNNLTHAVIDRSMGNPWEKYMLKLADSPWGLQLAKSATKNTNNSEENTVEEIDYDNKTDAQKKAINDANSPVQSPTILTNDNTLKNNNNPLINPDGSLNLIDSSTGKAVVVNTTKTTSQNTINTANSLLGGKAAILNKAVGGTVDLLNPLAANSLTSVGSNTLFDTGFKLGYTGKKYNGNQPKSAK